MGTFSHSITLISISNGSSETIEGLVDTGAMFTVIPTSVLERIGVKPFRTLPVRFANGLVEQWEMGQVEAELNGERIPILCLFGAENFPPLIGDHTLEAFLLAVDPVEGGLAKRQVVPV